MMQCALAVQGWGHACEVSGTTYFIYLGCFMHRAVRGLHTLLHPFVHIVLAAPCGYPYLGYPDTGYPGTRVSGYPTPGYWYLVPGIRISTFARSLVLYNGPLIW